MNRAKFSVPSVPLAIALALAFAIAFASPSTLSAQTWQSLGPQSGNATALIRDPQNRLTIYAILSPGGIYKSLDGGASWSFAGTGIPSTAAIGGLAIDPAQTSTLYAAAGSLYKSTDSGAHWTALAAQPTGTIKRVFVSPFDSSILLIGTELSVKRSFDAGATWSSGLISGQIADAVFDPLHPGTVYLAILDSALYKSPDNGATWDWVAQDIQAVDLAFDPGSPNVLFAVVPAMGVYRSPDGGANWTIWNAGMDLDPPGYVTNYLTCFDPGPAGSGYYFAGTERGLYRSHDGGQYWGFQTTSPEYPATNAVLVDPLNKELVLAATTLGVYRSIVAGAEYFRSSDGIESVCTDAISLAISPVNPARIMLGTSLGLYRSDGRGGSWSFAAFSHYTNHVVRAIGAHPTDASVFATGTDFGLFRSPDGGFNWYLSYPKPNPTDIRISSLVFDPFQPARAYAGASMAWPGFYVSSDGGATWSFNNPPQGLSIRCLAADPSQEGVLYAGLDGGWPAPEGPPGYYLAKTSDRGATWTGLARTVIKQPVNSFFADPAVSSRLYVAGQQGFYKSEDGGVTWRRITGQLGSGEVKFLAIDPQSPHHLYAAAANTVFRSTDHGETWTAFGTGLPADTYVVLAVDPSDSSIVYAGSGGKGGLFRTGGGDIPQLRVDTDVLNFGVYGGAGATSPQKIRIFNGGTGTLNWTATVLASDAPFIQVSPASGTGNGSVSVSVDPAGVPAGGFNTTLRIADPAALGSPKDVRIQIKRYNSGPYGPPQPPFGSFDTPIGGATVRSSIAVTGWALDDMEVMGVKIYRDPVGAEGGARIYIGDAVFIEDTRPDIEALYLDYPHHRRAGWGYMLLTNFLPNGGNGAITLRAYATDKEGNEIELGNKTITCDNACAVKPFGAIDTPTQGGEISGARYYNFGWALTPTPNMIPTDGSTIGVWIDGVMVGRPRYNNYRDDIAALFPGYANSQGAVGVFDLDTTAYEDGMHNIAWSVEDNAGNVDGIGSRFFWILNSGGPSPEAEGLARNSQSKSNSAQARKGALAGISDLSGYLKVTGRPVFIRRGFNRSRIPTSANVPSHNEGSLLAIRELERIEILLDDRAWSADVERRTAERAGLALQAPGGSSAGLAASSRSDGAMSRWEGYLVIGDELRHLPIGSTLDSVGGVFSWLPGPGFLGDYRLVFIDRESLTRVEVTVRIK